MSLTTQLKLAGTHGGRIAIHLICLVTDHKFVMHFRGIFREFNKYRHCGC